MEKDKIVEGINKMYTIHLKIKDICKHNIEVCIDVLRSYMRLVLLATINAFLMEKSTRLNKK